MKRAKRIIEGHSDLFEMVNIFPKDSGLSKVVYVSVEQGGHPLVRVKVSSSGNSFTKDECLPIIMDILGEPHLDKDIEVPKGITRKDIESVMAWMQLNKDLLWQLWRSEIDYAQFKARQQHV